MKVNSGSYQGAEAVGADAALSAVTRVFKNLDLRIFSLASLVMSIQNVFRLAQHSLCGCYS